LKKHKIRLGRRFWRLWTALAVSSVGDGMFAVALPLLALQYTRNPLAVSAVMVSQLMPALLLGLPIGTLADRVNRRSLIVAVEIVRFAALAVFGTTLLLGRGDLQLVYATAFLLGLLDLTFDVVCGASLPSIVKERDLVKANARLMNAELTSENLLGQALGGAALAISRSLPFLADAVSFIFSAILVNAAIPDTKPDTTRSTAWQDLREGLRWFIGHGSLRLLTAVVASFAFCQAVVFGVLALYAREQLHLSSGGYGLLLALSSAGLVIGAGIAPGVHDRMGSGKTILIAGVVAAASYPALAVTKSAAVATVALLAETAMVIMGNVAARSLRQRLVPPAMQGRATSAYMTIIRGSLPIGALAGGLIASAEGTRGAFLFAGALQFGFLVVVAPTLLRLGTREKPQPRRIDLCDAVQETPEPLSRVSSAAVVD
jgi:predicted MFS family arabinose efflux permease